MSNSIKPGLLLPILVLATAAVVPIGTPVRAQESGAAAEVPADPRTGDSEPADGGAEPRTPETADDAPEPPKDEVAVSKDPGGLAAEKPKAPAEQQEPGKDGMTITATSPGTEEPGAKPPPAEALVNGETPEEELQRYFALYKSAMENEAYAEADMLAKRVVELSIQLFGINSLDSARALTNLGIAQHQNEQYEAAIANYQAAIDVIERIEDRLNSNLVNPLKGLGAAQLASGRPDLAAETFNRAVHITHVNEGPHNLDQVQVLESLAETYLAVGKFDDVETITEIIFGLEARDIDLESMAILPVLEKQAYWQHRLQLFEKERYTWRKEIDIIEEHRGDDDLRLIGPLTGLGKSYLYVGNMDTAYYQPTAITSGEVYLKRAVHIAEDNPDATWQMKEDTLLALGDFYILSGQANRARRVYEDTWQLLSAGEDRLANRREHLEKLVVLQDIHPPKYVGIDGEVRAQLPGDDYEEGKVVFDYSVSTRGFTDDVVLVEAQPAAFEEMQRTVQNDLRTLIYRPRLVAGEAVETDGLTYTHKFFYRQSDLEEVKQQAAGAAASD
ncbi:MAG TPA: tetratricopeptide repeat protein [Woeseiaceae bacterium]|nr:tetratricopeptide repeat protein [Woeseiaceae bacterium]